MNRLSYITKFCRTIVKKNICLFLFFLIFFPCIVTAQSYPGLRSEAKNIIKEISKLKKKYPHFKYFRFKKNISESQDSTFWISLHYEQKMVKMPKHERDSVIKTSAYTLVPDEKDGISLTMYFFTGQWKGQAVPFKQYELGKLNLIFFLNAGSNTEKITNEIDKIIKKRYPY